MKTEWEVILVAPERRRVKRIVRATPAVLGDQLRRAAAKSHAALRRALAEAETTLEQLGGSRKQRRLT